MGGTRNGGNGREGERMPGKRERRGGTGRKKERKGREAMEEQ